MPKEKIELSTPDGPKEIVPVVSWGREGGYVQIATLSPNAHEVLTRWTEATPEWVAASEEFHKHHRSSEHPDAPKYEETAPGTSFRMFDGFHATLYERWQVNALIRLLKRARDAAFGRDE